MISHLLQIYYGTQTWFAESIDTLLIDLQECRPNYFFGVPRVWEKFYAGIQNKLQSADPNDRKVKLAYRAVDVGRRVAVAEQEAVQRGGKVTDARVGMGLRMQHALLDRLVLSKIREALGLDRCELALSAAAPLGAELIWFFHSIGIKICEGYGQSEDNGPTTWNPPDAIQIGTVGTPLSGVEVKIAEDGEILVKGGNVMRGYYKDDEATRGIIDAEGWMHSGDVGDQDELGYVTITDRKKDLIITAGGKNIAPQEIENRIKLHDLVSQAVVIGDGRPFLTALITLDEEGVLEWANQQGIAGDMSQIASHERTLEEIGSLVDEVNSSVAKVERVRKFRVLTRDFLEEEDEITPTLKVKRRTINQVYAEAIEEMYDRSSSEVSAASAPRHT
jgi:long-chain acyl-CoA synthetase